MSVDGGFEDLFTLARSAYASFVQQLAAYGVHPSPSLQVRRGRDLLSFYDPREGHIYISFPDPSNATAKLQVLVLRAALGAPDTAELMRFLRIFVPYIVAHELGHHLRHHYGMAGHDAWHEEQVANHLALALTRHHLAPSERAFARGFLARAMELQGADAARAISSYASIAHALHAAGQIDDAIFRKAGVMQALTRTDAAALLKASGALSRSAADALDQRPATIAAINDEYTKNVMAYMATQIGWLHLALNSAETHYVHAFARSHLALAPELLPVFSVEPDPDERTVRALFQAALDTRPMSAAAGQYFYKRYRSALIARVCGELGDGGERGGRPTGRAGSLLENWSDADTDPLDYLVEIVAHPLGALFPKRLGASVQGSGTTAPQLPHETDRRLWRHVRLGDHDDAARLTLERLDLLNRMEIFQPLPADAWLELAHGFCRVGLSAGETLIWEGERNDDVYTVIEGALDVLVSRDGADHRVGTIAPGEVFGEVAFLTGEHRTATVRAAVRSECLALRSADLHVLAFRNPSILLRVARVLARRVSTLNRRVSS